MSATVVFLVRIFRPFGEARCSEVRKMPKAKAKSKERIRSAQKGLKYHRINVKHELEILDQLECAVSEKALMEEYNAGKSTVSDVKYAKEKLLKLKKLKLLATSETDVALKCTRVSSLHYEKNLKRVLFNGTGSRCLMASSMSMV